MKKSYLFILIIGFYSVTCLAQSAMTPALREASQLQKENRLAEAESAIRNVLSQNPKNQLASLFLGLNQKYQRNFAMAEQTLSATIALNPGSIEASQALFLIAKSQQEDGRSAAARQTIQQMKAEYPDSGWLPQALLLDAQITSSGIAEATARLDKQNAAEKVYARVVRAKESAGTTATIAELKSLANNNKGLPIELQARESIAHLLSTDADTSASIEAFTTLLEDVAPFAPQSRIVQNARLRLGYLYKRVNDNEKAMSHFMSIVNSGTANKQLLEEAYLQSSGVAFEFLQRDNQARKPVYANQWEELHRLFDSVRTLDGASTETLIRSDLMKLEAYDWSGHPEKALSFGKVMLQRYAGRTDCKTEIATALIIMARLSKDYTHQYQDCITYAEQALALFPTEKEIWPGMDHLQRAYFEIYTASRLSGDQARAKRAHTELAQRFPESKYLQVMR